MAFNRVYIASKVNLKEPEVRVLITELKQRGYEILYDWTQRVVEKPFTEHEADAHDAAEEMARAVMQCDIIIVLLASGGLGLHIETGGALVAGIIMEFIAGQRRKRIFVVGEGNERSVFYFHKSVERLPTQSELLKRLPPL